MQLAKWIARVVGVLTITLGGAATAYGQEAEYSQAAVTFSDVKDAVPGRFFDAATTAADPADPNTLVIGLNTGLDFRTFKYADFRASSQAFSHTSAMDTISFRVRAPEGYYIASITYAQAGGGSVIRTGRAAGMTNWVVGDLAADLGVFGTSPTLSDTIDLSDQTLTDVPVSITNSLFAFSTPSLGSATVTVTSARVVVKLEPLSTPSAPEPEPEAPSVPEPPPPLN